MLTRRLSAAALARSAKALREELRKADHDRFDRLIELIGEDGAINLGSALESLYPRAAREAALTNFRQFRARLKAAAAEAGLELKLVVDTQTRAAPDARRAWFEGADDVARAVVGYTEGETAGVERVGQAAVELTDVEDGKQVVRYFISYAHKDERLKKRLIDRLGALLDSSKHYRFEPWDDAEILPGDEWHTKIQHAIARCQFGLMLVSPEFLRSRYISGHELPSFVARGSPEPTKRAIPVALRRVPFDGTIDLKGLERVQVFHDSGDKAFVERTTDKTLDDFARELFQQIVRVVAQQTQPPAPREPQAGSRVEVQLHRQIEEFEKISFVATRGIASSLEKLEPEERENAPGARGDALDYLMDWVSNPESQPYCALLGDLGFGKTTTCMAFAKRLLDARGGTPSLPRPIFLDLRHLGEIAAREPDLAEILTQVLKQSWRSGSAEISLSAQDIIRLVQEEGALAIFDGLDEVLVHLSPGAGQRFTRQLFRILPPRLAPRQQRARRGRLLLSCRTHYFRTLRDQKTHFTGEDRDGIRPEDFRAFVLLPFDEAQVREYLRITLPGEDPERVLGLIGAVHNLSEMAERPYTLSLIARHIPEIERWKLEGRKVTGAMLYGHMVRSWLERDTGKHQLAPEHKEWLMEHCAAELWRSGDRLWEIGRLEQWLVDFLGAHPGIAAHYTTRDRELLKEDLRTATFLVREGEDRFRFAHTSLLEFFLARYLYRALLEGAPERWALPIASPETLDFLGQMLEENTGREATLATLRALRDAYRPLASEQGLRYALIAAEKGYPAAALARARLEGADLRGWVIAGREDAPLNLSGAVFRGANVSDARIEHARLDGADFTGTDLARTELFHVRVEEGRFDRAILTGTLFRDARLRGASFLEARFHRAQWLGCLLQDTRGLPETPPAAFFARCQPPRGTGVKSPARLASFTGHRGWVSACAYSPDGRHIASGSDDRTLRVWDAQTGEPLLTLMGHVGRVSACAYSPDGRRIASGSSDRTLRVWDVQTGESLLTLTGHTDRVSACAYSLDARHIASASDDRTLRVWDAQTGETLLTLMGHTGAVWACAHAPDGRHIASGSDDRTLRVWDAQTGEPLLTLMGHTGAVWACAHSPDGRHIASGSDDQTLRIWDAQTGEPLLTLMGHTGGIRACAYSPDGRYIASASDDQTLRVWDAQTGELLLTLVGHTGEVSACAYSPDERHISSGSRDLTLRVWDAQTGDPLLTLMAPMSAVFSCAYSPDGRHIASDDWKGPTLRVWDAQTGDPLLTLTGHTRWVFACAYSPHGRHIASASFDETLRVWDAQTGDPLLTLTGHTGAVRACAYSPDGRHIASASDDQTLRVWDAQTGDPLLTLTGHTYRVTACAYSPDGRHIASGSEDQTLRVWDAETGDPLLTLTGHTSAVFACAYSPDGRHIASASFDQTLRVWGAQTGEPLLTLMGHAGPVSACAYSPDGRHISSASWDGSLRIWDAQDRKERIRIQCFGQRDWAGLDPTNNRILWTQGAAWRRLGWLALDPERGVLERYPAEVFGPLPERR